MLEHHLQKQILAQLVICESARFAELKPANVDGNIFTYHLRQLIKQKYVEKCDDGSYCLTSSGKALGINSQLSPQAFLEQAHSILLLVVRDGSKWLIRKRLAQPEYGKLGFIHGEPVLGELIATTASRVFKTKAGLEATFSPRGSGYIRIFKDNLMESFTHFTLLEAGAVSGSLIAKSGNGENTWVTEPDFAAPDMIPSMADIVNALEQNHGHIFLELSYEHASDSS